MKLSELLCTHDWAYEYIDTGPGWDRGNRERKAILAAIRSPTDAVLAASFVDRVPTPEREAYLASLERALEACLNRPNNESADDKA